MMKNFAISSLLAGILGSLFITSAQANTAVVSGTIFKQSGGTTFDTWNIDALSAGSFKVDVLAFEASQKQTSTAGYYESDLNGDGEITFLDPEVTIYSGSGLLGANSYLARCDDVANNCSSFNNGTLSITDAGASGSTDGSLMARDPVFNVSLTTGGQYRLLIADYLLSPAEAATGINTNDTLTLPTGLAVRDHGDYRITLSSETMNFAVSGNTITVSAVPELETMWLFGAGLATIGTLKRRKRVAPNT